MTQLAARANMDIAKLSRIERGLYNLSVKDLLRLAAELGCEASEILPPPQRWEPAAS